MSNGCRSLTIPDLDEINIIGRLKTLVRAYNIVEQWGEGWESSRGFAPNCVCHLRCGMVYPKLFRTWVHNILRRLLCSRCIFYVIHLVTRVLVRRNLIHQMLMDTMVHSFWYSDEWRGASISESFDYIQLWKQNLKCSLLSVYIIILSSLM